MRINPIIALVAAIGMTSAMADTVYLINGGAIEGRVTYEDGRIVVEKVNGKVYLDSSKIDHIEKSDTVMDEFDAKFAAVKAKGNDALAEDWAQVGRFAADHGMRERAEKCFFKALALDSDNATARQALGYEKFQNRWMTSDEANLARGLVKYKGVWVTPEAMVDLMRLDNITDAERARAAAEAAKAEQERLKLERLDTEVQLIEADREGLRTADDLSGSGVVFVSAPRLPGVPVVVAPAPSHSAAPSHSGAASRPAPPPTTSFSPVQVETPDATIRLGTGGNISVQPRR